MRPEQVRKRLDIVKFVWIYALSHSEEMRVIVKLIGIPLFVEFLLGLASFGIIR